MKKFSTIMLLLLCCIADAVAGNGQYWSTWSATHNVSDKTQVGVLTEVYFRDSTLDDYVYDEYITYARKIGYGFTVLGQLYFESVKSSAGWNGTRSVVGGLSYMTGIPRVCNVKVEDRFFYRLNSPSEWDYHRPRLYVMRTIGPLNCTLSDEMRIDLTGARADVFYRNRIYATVSTRVSSMLTVGLGYLRQSDKVNGTWDSFDGVQSLVSLDF